MGNAESNPVRNMDKRTARREYRNDFERAIQSFRHHQESEADDEDYNGDIEANLWERGNIRVCMRKRPIFKHEITAGEFDCVTCPNPSNVIIHDARMHIDMKRQFIKNHEFSFDRSFSELTDNEQVYQTSVLELVRLASLQNSYSTCMVYGQTGSGKTFTMSSIYQYSARDIFDFLEQDSEKGTLPNVSTEVTVSVSFFEVAGDYCFDLLNGFESTTLLSSQDGSVHAMPVVECVVQNAEELSAMIKHGCSIRSTAGTGVHDTSSRSHAILRIYIQRAITTTVQSRGRKSATTSTAIEEGTLTLVDLAGSEHRIDSMYHGAERRKEGAQINASLMALKECIRARAGGNNCSHHYRKSKLTMALKSSFLFPTSRTLVIATVSPASKDTEHSLNTLRHACIMSGAGDRTVAAGAMGDGDETRFMVGGRVTTMEVGEVNVTEISRNNKALKKKGKQIADVKTSNGNVNSHSSGDKAELTDKEKAKMRRQAERRAFSSLNPSLKQLLTKARSEINSDRQRRRLLGLWSGTAAGNPQALTGAREALAISMKEIQQEQLRVSQQLQTAEEDEEEGEDEEAQVVTSKSTKKQSTRSRELLAAQHQIQQLQQKLLEQEKLLNQQELLASPAKQEHSGDGNARSNPPPSPIQWQQPIGGDETPPMAANTNTKRKPFIKQLPQPTPTVAMPRYGGASGASGEKSGYEGASGASNPFRPRIVRRNLADQGQQPSEQPPREVPTRQTVAKAETVSAMAVKEERGHSPPRIVMKNSPPASPKAYVPPKKSNSMRIQKEWNNEDAAPSATEEQEQQQPKKTTTRTKRVTAARPAATPAPMTVESSIAALEDQLVAPGLSEASKFGLKKQLAAKKATLLREQRKAESQANASAVAAVAAPTPASAATASDNDDRPIHNNANNMNANNDNQQFHSPIQAQPTHRGLSSQQQHNASPRPTSALSRAVNGNGNSGGAPPRRSDSTNMTHSPEHDNGYYDRKDNNNGGYANANLNGNVLRSQSSKGTYRDQQGFGHEAHGGGGQKGDTSRPLASYYPEHQQQHCAPMVDSLEQQMDSRQQQSQARYGSQGNGNSGYYPPQHRSPSQGQDQQDNYYYGRQQQEVSLPPQQQHPGAYTAAPAQQPRVGGRYQARSHLGASSAPFGNEYSWDK